VIARATVCLAHNQIAHAVVQPIVGTGTFWVIERPPRLSDPSERRRPVAGPQPVKARIAEVRHAATRDESSSQLQYKVEAPFLITPARLGQWDQTVTG
jgi:hypothetical protein